MILAFIKDQKYAIIKLFAVWAAFFLYMQNESSHFLDVILKWPHFASAFLIGLCTYYISSKESALDDMPSMKSFITISLIFAMGLVSYYGQGWIHSIIFWIYLSIVLFISLICQLNKETANSRYNGLHFCITISFFFTLFYIFYYKNALPPFSKFLIFLLKPSAITAVWGSVLFSLSCLAITNPTFTKTILDFRKKKKVRYERGNGLLPGFFNVIILLVNLGIVCFNFFIIMFLVSFADFICRLIVALWIEKRNVFSNVKILIASLVLFATPFLIGEVVIRFVPVLSLYVRGDNAYLKSVFKFSTYLFFLCAMYKYYLIFLFRSKSVNKDISTGNQLTILSSVPLNLYYVVILLTGMKLWMIQGKVPIITVGSFTLAAIVSIIYFSVRNKKMEGVDELEDEKFIFSFHSLNFFKCFSVIGVYTLIFVMLSAFYFYWTSTHIVK